METISTEEARRQYARAREESSIMKDSIRRAYQTIGDLLCSAGDQSEDVKILRGLIEGWEVLEAAHEEEMSLLRFHHSEASESSASEAKEVA